MDGQKSVWESKTVWLNIVTALAAVLAVPEITGIIPAEAMPYLLALNATLNIIVRVFLTTQPVRVGGAQT